MADASVRPAVPADAADIADVQVRAWRTGYAGLLPDELLSALTVEQAEAVWRRAIEAPPTPRHAVLVASESGRTVGFAALGPADDGDLDFATSAELLALHVDPDRTRQGHGSRLLSASIDRIHNDGGAIAVAWLLDGDVPARSLYEASGWAADGSTRKLDAGLPIRQIRLHTALR